jgi:hypothetical protein
MNKLQIKIIKKYLKAKCGCEKPIKDKFYPFLFLCNRTTTYYYRNKFYCGLHRPKKAIRINKKLLEKMKN